MTILKTIKNNVLSGISQSDLCNHGLKEIWTSQGACCPSRLESVPVLGLPWPLPLFLATSEIHPARWCHHKLMSYPDINNTHNILNYITLEKGGLWYIREIGPFRVPSIHFGNYIWLDYFKIIQPEILKKIVQFSKWLQCHLATIFCPDVLVAPTIF